MPDNPAKYVFQRVFTDFDALAEETRAWDLELRQLDSGPFEGELNQFGSGDVHISRARFRRLLKQTGAPPAGLRTIAVPAEPNVTFEWRKSRIDDRTLMVFPLGASLDVLSDAGFHVFTCSFPEELLADVADALHLRAPSEFPTGFELVRCNGQHMAKIRRLLHGLRSQLTSDLTVATERCFHHGITEELPSLLLQAGNAARPERSVTPTRRGAVLKAAIDYIDGHIAESITVPSVCRAAQVSIRTLELVFAERLGISPKQYIRATRLNMARKALKAAAPAQQRVVDIANDCGFWHMGQFAADYRKHFGELPSSTLLYRT